MNKIYKECKICNDFILNLFQHNQSKKHNTNIYKINNSDNSDNSDYSNDYYFIKYNFYIIQKNANSSLFLILRERI